MRNGGTSLFDFVLKGYNSIIQNKLTHFEWQNVSKILFKQMSFDISLENILINDVLMNMKTLQH